MTCSRCQAGERRIRSPLATLPGWDIAERIVAEQHNAEVLQLNRDRDQWRDTVEPELRRFREPREPGKVPVDPDAEQLALDVVREMGRVG